MSSYSFVFSVPFRPGMIKSLDSSFLTLNSNEFMDDAYCNDVSPSLS
jgi:hypothetical protein